MQKIISVFQRNYDTDRLIRNEVVPGAEWVLAGEGKATRKFDGSACMVRDGKLYKRYDAKKGKTPPEGFIPAQEPDPVTGHHPGWLPVREVPADKWFVAAFHASNEALKKNASYRHGYKGFPGLPDGTYEACGPHFQGGAESGPYFQFGNSIFDLLIPHGQDILENCPRDFDGIREYLRPLDIEGIVFHHPDGRMAKVKKKDYGLPRKPVEVTMSTTLS